MMKQEISALVDGELFEDEADALLDKMKRQPNAQQDWAIYQLIGDALRQPDHLTADISASFKERLALEPAILAPYRRSVRQTRYFALSAAASVLALALVAWLSSQVSNEPAPQMAAVTQSDAVRPASFSASSSMNDYLMAHQEVSPSANVQGTTSYIRTVSER
jgi:sigma-E factor negative regulatory protein RseA